MRRNWTPSIVPNGHDQTFYLVINNYGTLGPAFAETDVGEADLETTITDLMSGQYSDPVRVSRSTPPNIGLRMPRRMSRGRLCVALIFEIDGREIYTGYTERTRHGRALMICRAIALDLALGAAARHRGLGSHARSNTWT